MKVFLFQRILRAVSDGVALEQIKEYIYSVVHQLQLWMMGEDLRGGYSSRTKKRLRRDLSAFYN